MRQRTLLLFLTHQKPCSIINYVQCSDVKSMNTFVTSKGAILALRRELTPANGLQFLNMRSVAEKFNISLGSL